MEDLQVYQQRICRLHRTLGCTPHHLVAHYPQSNGHAEAAVKAVQALDPQNGPHRNIDREDFDRGLLELRKHTQPSGRSPAQKHAEFTERKGLLEIDHQFSPLDGDFHPLNGIHAMRDGIPEQENLDAGENEEQAADDKVQEEDADNEEEEEEEEENEENEDFVDEYAEEHAGPDPVGSEGGQRATWARPGTWKCPAGRGGARGQSRWREEQ
ncbi:troponin T, skeletal muscle-like [Macrobrachium nipponense]|uniref:troponin T, skeletal muscle-like n=1 Tax=Macrobrachium nipponense TaxID=159736 RepID=UPI0030C7C8D8